MCTVHVAIVLVVVIVNDSYASTACRCSYRSVAFDTTIYIYRHCNNVAQVLHSISILYYVAIDEHMVVI